MHSEGKGLCSSPGLLEAAAGTGWVPGAASALPCRGWKRRSYTPGEQPARRRGCQRANTDPSGADNSQLLLLGERSDLSDRPTDACARYPGAADTFLTRGPLWSLALDACLLPTDSTSTWLINFRKLSGPDLNDFSDEKLTTSFCFNCFRERAALKVSFVPSLVFSTSTPKLKALLSDLFPTSIHPKTKYSKAFFH